MKQAPDCAALNKTVLELILTKAWPLKKSTENVSHPISSFNQSPFALTDLLLLFHFISSSTPVELAQDTLICKEICNEYFIHVFRREKLLRS